VNLVLRLQEDEIMSAQENEKAAVRTTIVGGRPPGSGRNMGTIPRGIEVLVKKAAVDLEFRELLFDQRGGAAAAIELELDPAENAMLNAIPREQLAQIVRQTTVPPEQRRVFLGKIAVAMLAVLGVGIAGCGSKSEPELSTLGIQPDRPKRKVIHPDRPTNAPPPVQPPLPAPAGVRPDLPSTNSPSTNNPPPPPTRGIQPDRP
jgi:hypothetical protein